MSKENFLSVEGSGGTDPLKERFIQEVMAKRKVDRATAERQVANQMRQSVKKDTGESPQI